MSINLSSKPKDELRPVWDPRHGFYAYRRAVEERAARQAESSTTPPEPERSKKPELRPGLRRQLELLRQQAQKRERRRWKFPERVLLCQSGRFRACWRNRETGEEFQTPFRCRSFRCKRCGRKRGLDDADDIRAVLEAWEADGLSAAFIVLTFPRKRFKGGCWGRMECWDALPKAWNRLRHRLRRRGLLGPYLTVMEAHRDGWPHMNLVMAGPLGEFVRAGRWREVWRVLVREAKASGFGFEVWVSKKVAGRQLAGYLAKYLTKPEQVPVQGPKGLHRVRYSFAARAHLRQGCMAKRNCAGAASGKAPLSFLGLVESNEPHL